MLEPYLIVFVIKHGSDPIVAGQRIAGPNAGVSSALSQPPTQGEPAETILLRTFVVTVPVGRGRHAASWLGGSASRTAGARAQR